MIDIDASCFNLPNCYVCGGTPLMKKDAKGRFQIRCSRCRLRTKWEAKVQCVSDWFNVTIYGQRFSMRQRRIKNERRTEKTDL